MRRSLVGCAGCLALGLVVTIAWMFLTGGPLHSETNALQNAVEAALGGDARLGATLADWEATLGPATPAGTDSVIWPSRGIGVAAATYYVGNHGLPLRERSVSTICVPLRKTLVSRCLDATVTVDTIVAKVGGKSLASLSLDELAALFAQRDDAAGETTLASAKGRKWQTWALVHTSAGSPAEIAIESELAATD